MNAKNNKRYEDLFKQFFDKNNCKFDDYIMNKCKVYSFPQGWGSTALGFGGIGGASMTEAQTTVIFNETRSYMAVFFGDRLAYEVSPINAQTVAVDLEHHIMASVRDKTRYEMV